MSQLRSHFPERDAYLDRLAQHYADGLLDDAGFEARRDLLLHATTHGQMLAAFDALPKPRYRDGGNVPVRRRGAMGRRTLLLGGVGALGAVGLATVFGLGGRTEYVGGDPVSGPVEFVDDSGEVMVLLGVDHALIDEVYYTLLDRGLTLVSVFNSLPEGVDAVAMSPRAPGELHTVTGRPDRPVVVSEASPAEVPLAVELDQLVNALHSVPDQAVMDLGGEGYPATTELVFTERGTTTFVVEVVRWDNSLIGRATYDLDGNLTALEEN